MLREQQQVCWLDPLDVAWGLRSSSDGRTAGYGIIVMGGEHGDLPLEATTGAIVAEFVVSTGASVILALRHLSMSDQRRFATDFFEHVFALKGKTGNRTPLHLVLDECDEFVPQRIMHGYERLFGAVDRIVRRGRSSGLGVTLISQRPAVVNKDVLSQCETLVCHRTISPQDRKALDGWIAAHDVHGQRDAFLSSLAILERGEAWVWSPGWLDVFERVKIRAPQTFDSSSTPKAGDRPKAAAKLAKVDLDELRSRMSETIERAKADDPRELRRQIEELRKDLASARQCNPGEVAAAESRGFKRGISAGLAASRDAIDKVARQYDGTQPPPERMPIVLRPDPPPPRTSGALSRMERAFLITLADRPTGYTKAQLRLLTGYADSGPVSKSFAKLVSEGYAAMDGNVMRLTEAGRVALGEYNPLPKGDDLRRELLTGNKLSRMEKVLLAQVIDRYPADAGKGEARQAAGYADSGPVSRAFAKLIAYGYLVQTRAGRVRAAQELFG